ncbi:hypothetical protein SS50377_28192 [Spironucleus salmonicida]|uniref:Uncharacterized protein n=1 Tax=Spironucleus salmonicida TaxID=348837 RepID=V6LP34_9EUKA|nr:hypothetical protein SS50377_28192 [Spironucleus salmonicida]|eukprot:EST46365.1 hypothetical protein SS50377_13608 [Spironucleus salmonicida]
MAEEQIQFLNAAAMPQTEVDDITVKVADIDNVPQQKLQKFQDRDKLPTTINGIDVSYLSKFVLPYNDAYETVELWSTQQDIALL